MLPRDRRDDDDDWFMLLFFMIMGAITTWSLALVVIATQR